MLVCSYLCSRVFEKIEKKLSNKIKNNRILIQHLTMSSYETETSFYSIKSIYIPRIFENITQDKIKNIFEVLDLGIISHIDLVPRGHSKLKMAFIHFKEWFDNPSAQNLAKKILDPTTQAKIVYDDPWYWILLPNNKPIGLPREETIEGLKQIVCEYKLIIDDLEAQLFQAWKQDKNKNDSNEDYQGEELDVDVDVNSTSPVGSTSSWEMSDFDENPKNKKEQITVLQSSKPIPIQQSTSDFPAKGFVAKISNWHSDKERKILGHVNFEHLHKQESFRDLEMCIKEKTQTSPHLHSSSYAYSKIVPIESINYQESKKNDVSILIEDNIPNETMFDSKGNRYVRQDGKWFKIEERKIEQHFWCDP